MADFEALLEDIKNFDVNDIDFNRVGVWPLAGKVFLACVLVVAMIAACYFLFVKEKNRVGEQRSVC